MNRLDGDDKDYGHVVDYKDLFKNIETAVEDYTSGAFDAFDAADVEGLISSRAEKAGEDLMTARDAWFGVPIPRWGIRLMKTKWGSCNPEKGLVWLNLDLAKKPLAALDYVILHEIAHFVSPRHDEIFLLNLDRHMPGWRQIRSDLNALPLSE